MLYHTARISLNRPFMSPTPESNVSKESLKICDISADIIVSIVRRFKAQHSLRNCPLVFVHGSIKAVDAILAAALHQDCNTPITKDTSLLALDAALAEMSNAWILAGQARKGLQDLLNTKYAHKQEEESTSSPSLASGVESTFTNETTQDDIYTDQSLKFPDDNFHLTTSILAFQSYFHMMPYDNFVGTDPTLWDPLCVIDNGNGTEVTHPTV